MITELDRLKKYRETIYYSCLNKRRDASLNLLDALCSAGHQSRSVTELSEAPCFKRQYSSITDAVSDGLPETDWKAARHCIFELCFKEGKAATPTMPCFVLDCTSNPRPFANTLADRTMTHVPNPAPGNKPVAVGHQYSCVALFPTKHLTHDHRWLIPLSMERVGSDQKGNERGMQQLNDQLKQLGLSDQLTVSIGDTLYGTEQCRISASKQPKLIHLFRLNSKRNVFESIDSAPEEPTKRGRQKVYGAKMALNDSTTHAEPDEQLVIAHQGSQGNAYHVKLRCWKNRLLRGSRNYPAHRDPMTVIEITLLDSNHHPVFKRSLWVAVFGKARDALPLDQIYSYYASRYHIEHFFRFGKTQLLLTAYQTNDVTHEENWWRFHLLAYNQLYLSSTLVPRLPKPWERYLPEYRNNTDSSTATPSQTQRGFYQVLTALPPLAATPTPRGKPVGRKKGEKGLQHLLQAVIFKKQRKKAKERVSENIISGIEQKDDCPNPQKIQELVQLVTTTLANLQFSKEKFNKLLLDSS